LPDGEQRFEAALQHLRHPVVVNLLKKQVAERDSGDSLSRCTLARRSSY
jgi:hypothetical protein